MFFNDKKFKRSYCMIHTRDDGRYKVGTRVVYTGTKAPLYTGDSFIVLASNVQDLENTEYLLDGFPFLVWESEISKESDNG